MRVERTVLEWRQVASATTVVSGSIIVPAGPSRSFAGGFKGRACGEVSGIIGAPGIVPAIQWLNLEFTPIGTPIKLLPGTNAWTAQQFYPFDTTTPWQAIDANGANNYLMGRLVFLVSSGTTGVIAMAGVMAVVEIQFQ